MKACTKCGEAKPFTEFHKEAKGRDGIRSNCKLCEAARGAVYRATYPERVAARRARNQPHQKAHYAAHREEWAARYAANREKRKASCAAYYAANPETFRALKHNRRARKLAVGGKLSKDIEIKLFALQRGKCACCKRPLGDDYHLDHIMPLALGGTNTDDNIQLLRQRCNNQKHAKHPIDFMQQRGFLL